MNNKNMTAVIEPKMTVAAGVQVMSNSSLAQSPKFREMKDSNPPSTLGNKNAPELGMVSQESSMKNSQTHAKLTIRLTT